ncbi:C1 family peptidase [[Flexibacter] sp. ATCC 35208]|uniref:C1 family peptidase n=1 Tax=[Flexibacter] sp. ATCC 35208 TaxID=1936242 RepID=UPI0009D2D087|nr:C1 family peptidase [[Flexibacter] sp. ATCC 35208]OMP80047.1 hypothetical protein BW716_06020 [[Flexibacter] sp. ATCC 35208]
MSRFLPAVCNQGQQGACTAFAVAGALTILRSQSRNKTYDLNRVLDFNSFYSPAFIFNIAKSKYPYPRSEQCVDGISFIDAFLIARDYGSVPWLSCRYNPAGTAGCLSINYPDSKAIKDGRQNRIITFQRPDLDLNVFKCLLADKPGYPICISVMIDQLYKNASNNREGAAIWAKKGPPIVGQANNRHAMLIVGYADSIRCFKVLDSRGFEKGDNGFLWLSYDLLRDKVIYDAYVCSFDDNLLKSQKSVGATDLDLKVGSTKTSWLKQGYYRKFNGFKVFCSRIDRRAGTVNFSISDAHTDQVLVPNILLTLNQQKYFTLRGKTFSLYLKDFTFKGKNVFKKAIEFDISLSAERVDEQFYRLGSTKEDLELLFSNTFIRQGREEKRAMFYIGHKPNIGLGDQLDENNDVTNQATLSGTDSSLIYPSLPSISTYSYSGDTTIKSPFDFRVNNFLAAMSADMDDSLRSFLNSNSHLRVTKCGWQYDNLDIGKYWFSKEDTTAMYDSVDAKGNVVPPVLIYGIYNLYSLEGTLHVDSAMSNNMRNRLAKGVTFVLRQNKRYPLATITLRLEGEDVRIKTNGKIPVFACKMPVYMVQHPSLVRRVFTNLFSKPHYK